MSPIIAAALFGAAAFAQGIPVEGNPASKVRVIAYEDLQCPDCADYRTMLDLKLLPKYQDKVAFEHRDFPLPKHKWARKASIAARAFDRVRPELGLAFRVFLMSSQQKITVDSFDEALGDFARAHNTDPEKIRETMKDPAIDKAIEEDYQEGIARGIARTPTVLVNGEPFIETFTFEAISQAIDKALQETKTR